MKPRTIASPLLALASVLCATTALANAQDVVIMRRSISPPRPVAAPTPSPTATPVTPAPGPDDPTPTAPTPAPAPIGTAAWRYGDWTYAEQAPTCSDAAPQTRTATCERDGKRVAETDCGAREDVERVVARHDGCSTTWATGEYGSASPSCGEGSVTRRQVSCTRFGGDSKPQTVDDSLCGGDRPSETSAPFDATAGCTYAPTYGSYGECRADSPGSTTGHQVATVTGCVGTGPDAVASPVQTARCTADPAMKECTLTYKATHGAFGACTAGVRTAAVASCNAIGSDGSSREVQTDQCAPKTETCVDGTWSKASVYSTSSCVVGKRERWYAVTCLVSGQSVDAARCDAATRPSDERAIVNCQASCASPRVGYVISNGSSYGTVRGLTEAARFEAGRLKCEEYKASGSLFGCYVASNASTGSANVFLSENPTYQAGMSSSNTLYSCRNN